MAARSTLRALGLTLAPAAAALLLLGCNTVDSAADSTIAEQRTARPAVIIVQPFAISPDAAATPPAAPAAASGSGSTEDADQAAQRFRAALAANLVSAINAMGLNAVSADAPLPPGGGAVTIEGAFVSVPGGDSAEPPIVSLANAWPDVVVDVEIYETSDAGDRMVEDMELRISETNPLIPPGETGGEPTEPETGQTTIPPEVQAKLDAAARDGASRIAGQLKEFFEDQGWIAPAQG